MAKSEKFAQLLLEAANRLDLRDPTQTSKELLGELLAFLKALRECYQSLHWQSRGTGFLADHELFERLYAGIIGEVDALAEKAIGYTDDAYIVEVTQQTARMSTHVQEIIANLNQMTIIQCMLEAEKRLCKEFMPQVLNGMEQAGELSDGMENFLQGVADHHENHIYLLQRRLKTQKELDELTPVIPNISPIPEADNDELDDEFEDMEEEAEDTDEDA